MAGQMEGLLKDVSLQLGAALKTLEDLRESYESLRDDNKEIRDRLKALEVSAIVAGQYGTKEHDALLRRLAEGDKLFEVIRNEAQQALNDAESARLRIKELQERLQKETEKRGKTRWDFMKILIECGIGALGFMLAKGVELMLKARSP